MGKKKSRAKYTSQGTGKSVSSARTSETKKAFNTVLDRALNVQRAYAEGRNPMITIPNPNPLETNRQFIRVPAKSVYGDPKKRKGFEIR
jgi:hypothetical protein